MKRLLVSMILMSSVISAWASGTPEATLTVEAAKPAGEVSPTFFGLMTEEINHAYDGGLYAELVQNRAFLDNANVPSHWSTVQDNGSAATIALDPNQPLDTAIPASLRLDVTKASRDGQAGIANNGYEGIPVAPNTEYHASFYAKSAPGFSGPVTVAIRGTDPGVIYAQGTIPGLTQEWKRYEVTLTTGSLTATTKARYVLTVDQPGTVWFSIASLFPPTWGNQPNGFRKDIMQMLVDLKPKFLRFPGGNFLEGDTIPQRFDWKKTVGPLAQRPGHWGPWGYRSTDGMGLFEFLLWCEDMNAEPVLAVYGGYSLRHEHVKPGSDFQPYVQDALDEIEYVTGPATSQWGALRARDGHPDPFKLTYVEIGNEDFFDDSGSYDARFAQFYDAIKTEYPQIQVISTIGNEQPGFKRVKSRAPDVLDEHYYRRADTFLSDSPAHFNSYDRKGPKIFVGEWASYETSFPPWDFQSQQEPPTPDMKAALGDAAWMAAMERVSDLVIMQCYAPLLVNVNPDARQWRPNLIGYDGLSVFGSPSYYAIQMFSRNLGDEILATTSEKTNIQSSATRDSKTGEINLKLVNPQAKAEVLRIHLNGVSTVKPTATAITLAAKPDATNSISDPNNVVPATSTANNVGASFGYTVPANAIVVLKIETR